MVNQNFWDNGNYSGVLNLLIKSFMPDVVDSLDRLTAEIVWQAALTPYYLLCKN